GLADTFSRYAYPATPALPWTTALRPDALDHLGAVARDRAAEFDAPDLHSQWFYGGGAIPRWAGYTIGAAWAHDHAAGGPTAPPGAARLLPADGIIPR